MSHTLQERSEYIQKFASHVSHEFKTPLTSMQGSLELLQEHADDMPEEQRQRFLSNLQDDTERLKRLVSRLLEQARADSLQGSSESTNLLSTLKDIESRYADISLAFVYDQAALDIEVAIANSALESVFSNLCDNSLQHNSTEISITVKHNNGQLHIYFQDNGNGVSASNQKRIFTPFFTTKRETGGTGLGLGIIKSILKASNGKIENRTVENGALFVICLDIVRH
jgi:signal transduction histidine kinase